MGVCLSSSHLHIFSLHIFSLHIFSSSHLHIFSLHIFSSSHLLIFTSSHLHIYLLIFTSAHLHICSSSLLHICSSSHIHIFTSSSHLHILTSSHLLLLPSCPLAPLALSFFSISLLKAGAGAVPTRVRSSKAEVKLRVQVVPRNTFARGSIVKNWGKIASSRCPAQTLSHEMRFDRQKLR